MEEDLAEMKDMLKSFFTKMEQRKTRKSSHLTWKRKGAKSVQKRLDRDTLSQICWQGGFTKHQKTVFVNAANNNLEHLTIAYSKDKIKREVFGDLGKTYKMHNEYSRSSTVTKSAHIVARMEEALQRLVYESEYNRYWTAGEAWEDFPGVLHILRLEALPRSRAGGAAAGRRSVPTRLQRGGNCGGEILDGLPCIRHGAQKGATYIMLAEDEETYGRMRSDPARSIPLKARREAVSRDVACPGLISRFRRKFRRSISLLRAPDGVRIFERKEFNDFVVVLDNVLQSWLSIRKWTHPHIFIRTCFREFDVSAKITQERAAKIVNVIDAASSALIIATWTLPPRVQPHKAPSTSEKTRRWTLYASTMRRR